MGRLPSSRGDRSRTGSPPSASPSVRPASRSLRPHAHRDPGDSDKARPPSSAASSPRAASWVTTGPSASTGSATNSLGLHPQSLRYLLRRMAELTLRDPRDPWQRLTLDIARTIGS
ncbi:helix-turn-helix domain-containing protein [Streptomyces sioyaensis]|uniref:helix-turn-helix domain-containing protein n=1 Tax=Streptomyces sioyaensis TaxID=67364 RepID=UPI003D73137A